MPIVHRTLSQIYRDDVASNQVAWLGYHPIKAWVHPIEGSQQPFTLFEGSSMEADFICGVTVERSGGVVVSLCAGSALMRR